MIATYEDFHGVRPGHFKNCTYEEMELLSAYPGFKDWRKAWNTRLEVGGTISIIEDLRTLLRWESGRMGAMSAALLKEVINRLEAGEE